MGLLYRVRCKKCKYNFNFRLGAGVVYCRKGKEFEKDISEGKYGVKLQKIINSNERNFHGCIDNLLYECEECKKYFSAYTKYIEEFYYIENKKKYERIVISKEEKCIFCESKNVKLLNGKEVRNIICPNCGIKMIKKRDGYFD